MRVNAAKGITRNQPLIVDCRPLILGRQEAEAPGRPPGLARHAPEKHAFPLNVTICGTIYLKHNNSPHSAMIGIPLPLRGPHPLRPFTRARAKKLARAAECLIYSLTPGGFWAAKRPKISDLRGFPRHFAMGAAGQRRRLQNSDRGVEIEPEAGSR